ncbi:MAG: hypothetical protein MUC48_09250 [Leptolyngbya sp. Prado105]|nr:hypothetical protein [Leptolyngbya sp. Prado105]
MKSSVFWLKLNIVGVPICSGVKVMDYQQRELRRAAAQAFAESLDKLEQTIWTPEDEQASFSCPIDLEQAVAEIEQLIQSQENSTSKQDATEAPSE